MNSSTAELQFVRLMVESSLPVRSGGESFFILNIWRVDRVVMCQPAKLGLSFIRYEGADDQCLHADQSVCIRFLYSPQLINEALA